MKKHFSKLLVLAMFPFLLMACSGHNEYVHHYDDDNHFSRSYDKDDDTKKYSFHEEFDGEDYYWKVYIEDGEIDRLYKDGERIDDSDLEKYEEFVFEKVEEIEDDLDELHEDLADMKHDLKKLKQLKHHNYEHNFKFDDHDFDFDIDIDFDSEKFEASMEHLSDALSNLDFDFDFNFDFDDNYNFENNRIHFRWDSDKFERGMQKLERKLEKLDNLNISIDMDMDGFAESMEKFGESIGNIEIDLSGLEDELEELKVELKKLDEFLDEASEELVEDGYIDNEDEEYDLVLNKRKMVVNGERLPEKLHKKYLDIYEDHFDRLPKSTFRLNRD
jgi:chromosome segregation ATPase